jgi:hypothetical protein
MGSVDFCGVSKPRKHQACKLVGNILRGFNEKTRKRRPHEVLENQTPSEWEQQIQP